MAVRGLVFVVIGLLGMLGCGGGPASHEVPTTRSQVSASSDSGAATKAPRAIATH